MLSGHHEIQLHYAQPVKHETPLLAGESPLFKIMSGFSINYNFPALPRTPDIITYCAAICSCASRLFQGVPSHVRGRGSVAKWVLKVDSHVKTLNSIRRDNCSDIGAPFSNPSPLKKPYEVNKESNKSFKDREEAWEMAMLLLSQAQARLQGLGQHRGLNQY